MKNLDWIISNKDMLLHNKQCKKRKFEEISLYHNSIKVHKFSKHEGWFFVDGYIIPRPNCFESFKDVSQEQLINRLYDKYGESFIHYIKGVFSIVIFIDNRFSIFNDRHSLKKYFTYSYGDDFCISNSLQLLSNFDIDYENAAIFSMLSHFIDGATLFKNVYSCKPGGLLKYDGTKLSTGSYWTPRDLLKSRKLNTYSIDFFAKNWKNIINNYIEYLQPKGISMTLTGGNDSRMVLAALLSLKVDFHAFTFGDTKSYDCVISKLLDDKIDSKHDIYFEENPTPKWFSYQAQRIINYGNSLINIHRAHRNDAIEKECIMYSSPEMIFTGLVGGEYIKEPNNNLVIPEIIAQIHVTKDKKVEIALITNLLQSKGIDVNKVNLQVIYDRLKKFVDSGNGLNDRERKFIFAYLFYGCTHHSQDSNVFMNSIPYVVSPYMDIDFIELISNYSKWYINKKINFYDSMFHSLFHVKITDKLAPSLSNIPYAKKGKYTANDLLHNKLKYIFLRLRYYISKDANKYPPNFPMGNWLYDFCKIEINKFNNDIFVLFDKKKILKALEENKDSIREQSWHMVTNPINLNMIYEFYEKAKISNTKK